MGNHQDNDGSAHDVAEQTKRDGHDLGQFSNQIERHHEKYGLKIFFDIGFKPLGFYSGIMTEGIQRAQDCRKWTDPHSLESFVVILGTTNAADGITALKKVVLDDKVATMEHVIDALDHNWEGFEDLRQIIINAPKYGNDDDYADEIAVTVHHGSSDVLAEFTDPWGFPWKGDGSGVSATYGLAFDCPATPDGRKDGQP